MLKTFISKQELAQAYFPCMNPRPARQKLMALINADQELYDRLCASGYKRLSHEFSPMQAQMIIEKLGAPFG